MLLTSTAGVQAQDAKATMDKAAKMLSGSSVSASYKATGQINESGTIAIKGKKFCAKGSKATVWFDGKTQWTYMKSTGEVSITNHNPKKPTVVNPYTFINIYKNGYDLSQKKVAAGTEVYMKATGKQVFSEIYVTLNAKLQPVQIRFKNSKGWSTVSITNYQTKKLPDSTFQFNKKDYPEAEVVDLRN